MVDASAHGVNAANNSSADAANSGRIRKVMLYPVYIDRERALNEGRKYPRELCVANPKIQEIKNTLERLKLKYEIENKKTHPKDQRVPGRILIEISGSKRETIKNILREVQKNRENKAQEQAGNKIPNLLNLVPRKKNKSKKK